MKVRKQPRNTSTSERYLESLKEDYEVRTRQGSSEPTEEEPGGKGLCGCRRFKPLVIIFILSGLDCPPALLIFYFIFFVASHTPFSDLS
jgi:hypothetical protein